MKQGNQNSICVSKEGQILEFSFGYRIPELSTEVDTD